jgi:DNA helicase HerA-like ATPase
MTVRLHIGDGFSFPLDFVTQTQAILAKKRVGKSYTASVEAEELLKAGEAIDRDELDEPTGYKRSSRDAYLSRLAARRLVEVPSSGMVQAAGALFD